MRQRVGIIGTVLALAMLAAGCGSDEPPELASVTGDTAEAAADGASVSITSPRDDATVARRFSIEMDADHFTIEPAGKVVEGRGHLHVMVDVDCIESGEVIPNDEQHRHFGKGQTSAQLFLEPGEHTLCLQAADGVHTALGLTDQVTVTVDGSLPYVTLGMPEGDTLTSPVALTMTANNVAVVPAGQEGGGHFHVMIDAPCLPTGETIPKDDQHVHFGDGSTTAELNLEPGEHTLCLQLGDSVHRALDASHTVTVTVA